MYLLGFISFRNRRLLVTSPVATGALVGLAPEKCYKSPKIEI